MTIYIIVIHYTIRYFSLVLKEDAPTLILDNKNYIISHMLPSMKVCKNIVKMSLQVNTFKRKFENKKAMTYVRINKSLLNTDNEAIDYEL